MELHPLETAAVRILFCGRPALTTGIVNLRVLLGGDGQYCLAEKRKAKLHHSNSHGTRGDAAVSNGVEVSADSREKRESVYRVCSSEGLPDGCYYVKADRHYWVMRMKGGLRAATSTTATSTQPSASLWNTQATLASSPMPLAATASAAEPSKVEDDVLARSTHNQGTAASTPAEAAGATAVTAESSSALTPADDAARASVARKKVISTQRKYTRRLKAVEEDMDKLPLITTTLSDPAPLAEASPTQEQQQQQQRASVQAVDVVGDVEAARGEQLLGTPLSVRQAAKVATDVLVAFEETPPSLQQQQQKKQWERRKKASRVHVDAVAEDCKDSEADAAGGRVSAKTTRGSSRAGGGNDVHGEVAGGTPLAERLAADASQPPKQPQHRGKRWRSDEVTAEDPPALPPVRHPSTQVTPLTSFPETSPLPTPEKSKAARRKMGLRQDEVKASTPASSANLRDATLPLPSTLIDSDTESAPRPASPARKSRKSSAATSAASAAATSDAADMATLSRIPTPPLSPPPLRPVPGQRQITSPHGKKTPSHAGTNTASLDHPPPRQAPPQQQQQQEEEKPPAKRSPASAPQETTPNILYSNRSSGVATPTARDIMQQQQHDRHAALSSPSTRSPVGVNRSASTSSLLGPLLSPLLQHQSQWSGIGSGAAGSRGLHESMMNGGSGGSGFFPSDSPALGFTQVHSTLAEEFSLDVSETESSSAASEYLCDVEE